MSLIYFGAGTDLSLLLKLMQYDNEYKFLSNINTLIFIDVLPLPEPLTISPDKRGPTLEDSIRTREEYISIQDKDPNIKNGDHLTLDEEENLFVQFIKGKLMYDCHQHIRKFEQDSLNKCIIAHLGWHSHDEIVFKYYYSHVLWNCIVDNEKLYQDIGKADLLYICNYFPDNYMENTRTDGSTLPEYIDFFTICHLMKGNCRIVISRNDLSGDSTFTNMMKIFGHTGNEIEYVYIPS